MLLRLMAVRGAGHRASDQLSPRDSRVARKHVMFGHQPGQQGLSRHSAWGAYSCNPALEPWNGAR